MKISYAITVCNEVEEIKKLLLFIERWKSIDDEIIILFDTTKNYQPLKDYLFEWCNEHNIDKHHRTRYIVLPSEFNGNFSDWKNKLNSLCNGDWIFNIDADEIPHVFLLSNLHEIIETNPEIEAYWISRINTLEGDPNEIKNYIKSQNWIIDKNNYINFPDKQLRLYKNSPNIKWVGKIHERIEGYKTITSLPEEQQYCLYHPKTLERQIKQNNFYSQL